MFVANWTICAKTQPIIVYWYSRGTALLETGHMALALESFENAITLSASEAHGTESPFFSSLVEGARRGRRR